MRKRRRKLSSKPTIDSIKEKFKNRFRITINGLQNRFYLDDTNTIYYNPDLVFWSKKNRAIIKAIIEVEQGTRKHVVGGVITADYCMGKKKQSPPMFILALNDDKKEGYQKRIGLFDEYKKHLSKIIIGNRNEIMKALSNLKD
jgi:hypothetical protein